MASFANFALILICLVAGFILRRLATTPKGMAHALNVFVIYVAFPALVFGQMPLLIQSIRLGPDFFIASSMAWIQIFVAIAIFAPLGRALGWPRATIGAVILTAGFGNTSFVGFPLLEAFIGLSAIPTGIVVDQVGSFLSLSTVGLICASIYAGARPTPQAILRRVFRFPPFLALLMAAPLQLLFPRALEALNAPLTKLGSTLVPLALVSVGLQLSFDLRSLRENALPLSLGLLAKLVLIPVIMLLLYVYGFGSHSQTTLITLIESAMAPMITAAILVAEFKLNSELANLMVGVGIPLSLLTVWLWTSVFQSLI